jgi:Asp-tRNA(Asn)/Glu-tRNA(Gln) amidotransferase A subunit family amidase
MLDPYIEAWELRELIIAREIRPREVAQFFLDRIQRLHPGLGAFITISAERALADADALERLSPDELRKHPLAGVPYSIKDLTWTKDIRTTFGSRNYENYIPPQDSEVARRLRAAGGIMLGKTATPEFGGRPLPRLVEEWTQGQRG